MLVFNIYVRIIRTIYYHSLYRLLVIHIVFFYSSKNKYPPDHLASSGYLLTNRYYGHISPVLLHTAVTRSVTAVCRKVKLIQSSAKYEI